MVSLSQLQQVPLRKIVLLVGPPGAGKSAFCQQVALRSLEVDKPIIYVTTRYGSSDAERALKERGGDTGWLKGWEAQGQERM